MRLQPWSMTSQPIDDGHGQVEHEAVGAGDASPVCAAGRWPSGVAAGRDLDDRR